jgi:hypothetical protein
MLTRDKQSSLFGPVVIYIEKSFVVIGSGTGNNEEVKA